MRDSHRSAGGEDVGLSAEVAGILEGDPQRRKTAQALALLAR